MKKVGRENLVRIAIEDTRSWEDPTFFVFEYDKFIGEFGRAELVEYLKKPEWHEKIRAAADTIVHLVFNFHGCKFNPKTGEFRGAVVEAPTLEYRNPELAKRRLGIQVDGYPVRIDTENREWW